MMGFFSDITRDIDIDKEKKKLQNNVPGLKELGNPNIPVDQQLIIVEKMAKDQSWLGKMSGFFQNAFKKALQYEQKRQVGVMNEFFDDMLKLGHETLHLHLKEGDMSDHMISYDGSEQWSPLNSQITISGKMNKFKAQMGLEAVKRKKHQYVTVYLQLPGMDDHYVEFDHNGTKIPFNKQMSTLGGL